VTDAYQFPLLATRKEFHSSVEQADRPVVVIFVSETCEVCRSLETEIAETAEEFAGKADFYAVQKQGAPEVVLEQKVFRFPTLFLFFEGEKVGE
jgi:thioredoxin 1